MEACYCQHTSASGGRGSDFQPRMEVEVEASMVIQNLLVEETTGYWQRMKGRK